LRLGELAGGSGRLREEEKGRTRRRVESAPVYLYPMETNSFASITLAARFTD